MRVIVLRSRVLYSVLIEQRSKMITCGVTHAAPTQIK